MRQIVHVALMLSFFSCFFVGVGGCGGTESGTQQITKKADPDPELNQEKTKPGRPAPSRR